MRCTSAGFVGPNRRPPDTAIAAGIRRGLVLSGHRSAVVTEHDVQSSDMIIVMSAQQAARVSAEFPGHSAKVIVLGDLDPMAIDKRTILDPWNGDAERFDACYDRIVRCADSLVALTAGAHAR